MVKFYLWGSLWVSTVSGVAFAGFPWDEKELRGVRYKTDLFNCLKATFHSKRCA